MGRQLWNSSGWHEGEDSLATAFRTSYWGRNNSFRWRYNHQKCRRVAGRKGILFQTDKSKTDLRLSSHRVVLLVVLCRGFYWAGFKIREELLLLISFKLLRLTKTN